MIKYNYINEHPNEFSILNQEEYLHICRQAYMFKMFPGEDRDLQFYLLLIKLSETERHLVDSKFALADYMMHLIISYRKLSVKKGLVSNSKIFGSDLS